MSKAGNMSLGNSMRIATPVVVIGSIWIGWRYIVAPILETLNLKDTRSEAESKALQEKIEKLVHTKDYWSPSFFQKPPEGYVALILTYQDSDIFAKKLYDAAGTLNDDEEAIYSVFRAMRYKTQVAYLVYWFNRLYGKDLYTWLKDKVLNNEELKTVLTITEKLPNGFKNSVSGKISGVSGTKYFDKIIEAVSQGNTRWARSLFKSLSPGHKKEFWKYYETTYYYEAQDQDNPDYVEELKSILI